MKPRLCLRSYIEYIETNELKKMFQSKLNQEKDGNTFKKNSKATLLMP